MVNNHEKFMRLAIAKARQGIAKKQTPFGACIVKNNKVVACTHNIVWKSRDITAHAEISAIRIACRRLKAIDLSGCVIYSTCEPCPMCFAACHWAKISTIVFGARIKTAKKFGFNELYIPNRQMIRLGKSGIKVRAGFLEKENLALFKFWSQRQGVRTY